MKTKNIFILIVLGISVFSFACGGSVQNEVKDDTPQQNEVKKDTSSLKTTEEISFSSGLSIDVSILVTQVETIKEAKSLLMDNVPVSSLGVEKEIILPGKKIIIKFDKTEKNPVKWAVIGNYKRDLICIAYKFKDETLNKSQKTTKTFPLYKLGPRVNDNSYEKLELAYEMGDYALGIRVKAPSLSMAETIAHHEIASFLSKFVLKIILQANEKIFSPDIVHGPFPLEANVYNNNVDLKSTAAYGAINMERY